MTALSQMCNFLARDIQLGLFHRVFLLLALALSVAYPVYAACGSFEGMCEAANPSCTQFADCQCDSHGCTEPGPPYTVCLQKNCYGLGWGFGCPPPSSYAVQGCGPFTWDCPGIYCPCQNLPLFLCDNY